MRYIVMSKPKHHWHTTVSLISLTAFCLLLASCATELKDDSVSPTASATATVTPPHAPTLPHNPASPTEPTPTPTEPPPTRSASVTHTVQPGDTLLGIAMAYDVPMAAIQLQNDIGDSTVVKVGQVLSIPPRVGWEGASRFWVVHVVKEGETLVGIAQTYGLKAETLKAVNGLADADLIGIDQELVLPLDAPAVARAPAPTSAPTHTSTPTPPHPPTATPALSSTAEPPAASPTPTALPAAPPPADVATWPYEIVRLINEARAQHGLPPLAHNETLAQIAQAHANDCLQRGWGSHTGSDGSTVKMRMLRVGYDPVHWSECWAHTQTPQSAMDMWMDEVSPNDPHRRTILSTWLTEVGVGVVQPDWGYYFFADFGQPRDGS